MRIAIVNDYLDPQNWGGAAKVAAEQALALKVLGHHVLITGASDSCVSLEGVDHVSWKYQRGLRGVFRLKRQTIAAIEEFSPDLTILHQPLSGDFVQKKFPHIRARYYFHSSWVDEVKSRGRRRGLKARAAIELRVISKSEKVFVSCPFTKTVLSQVDQASAMRSIELPLAVKSPPFVPSSTARDDICRQYNIDPDKKILCTFRRLVPRTGVDLFIEMLRDIPDAVGFIGGTGDLEKTLQQMALDFGLKDKVYFLGYLSDKEMIKILQGSDYSIVPSRELEGFGMFTLEAMACACPVIATPIGNNAHLLKSCGLNTFSSEVSAQSLVETYRSALKQDLDVKKLSEKVMDLYNWQRHVEELIC